jgi:hypothetical protein
MWTFDVGTVLELLNEGLWKFMMYIKNVSYFLILSWFLECDCECDWVDRCLLNIWEVLGSNLGLTEVYHGFPESLQACQDITSNSDMTGSFHIFYNSLFAGHPTIKPYVVCVIHRWSTERMLD